jgi:hypothetical protein
MISGSLPGSNLSNLVKMGIHKIRANRGVRSEESTSSPEVGV